MVERDQQSGDGCHAQQHQYRRVVGDAIEEGMQQQVDELEEEQQCDQREVLDGLCSNDGGLAEDAQEDAQRDDDERDEVEPEGAPSGSAPVLRPVGPLLMKRGHYRTDLSIEGRR